MDRLTIINAIERAKKQSEEYAQDHVILPFKEADIIVALLKEDAKYIKRLKKINRDLIERVAELEYFENDVNLLESIAKTAASCRAEE